MIKNNYFLGISTTNAQEELERTKSALLTAKSENELLNERLEISKQREKESKNFQEVLKEKNERFQVNLQRSESRANQLELQVGYLISYFRINKLN